MIAARALVSPVDFQRHIPIALLLGGMVAVCYLFFDLPAAIWARGLDPEIVAVFKVITAFGSSTPYLIGLVALYPTLRFVLKRPAAANLALFVLAAIIISGLTIDLIKPVVARWRPIAFFAEPAQYGFAFFKIGYKHNSFPSGHATTAWSVGCALILIFPRLRALWIVAAVVVAASRVVVGAHYPGDVIAGAWFGVVITLLVSRSAWFRGDFPGPGHGPRHGDDATATER